MRIITLTFIFLSFFTLVFASTFYLLDKNHSQLGFSIGHFGISHTEGRFGEFEASLVSSREDFSDARITMTAQVKSINTGVEMRDNDLRSANWFDAEKYPE